MRIYIDERPKHREDCPFFDPYKWLCTLPYSPETYSCTEQEDGVDWCPYLISLKEVLS